MSKTASQILTEDSRSFSSTDRYDVFLSHSYQDADVIHGVKSIIESHGLNVYVDWIDDAGLDRGKVTSKTAQVLRERIENLFLSRLCTLRKCHAIGMDAVGVRLF